MDWTKHKTMMGILAILACGMAITSASPQGPSVSGAATRSASRFPTFVGFSYARAASANQSLGKGKSRFVHLTREVGLEIYFGWNIFITCKSKMWLIGWADPLFFRAYCKLITLFKALLTFSLSDSEHQCQLHTSVQLIWSNFAWNI